MNADLFGEAPKQLDPKVWGYAANPGTGPQDETCKTCVHSVKAGRYWKCGMNEKQWSSCEASDIRLSAPACRFWEPKT